MRPHRDEVERQARHREKVATTLRGAKPVATRQLKPGTVLVRDYHGQRHNVTVVHDGFDWVGTTYPSLSAIARAMPSRFSPSAFLTTGTISPLPPSSATAKPRLT